MNARRPPLGPSSEIGSATIEALALVSLFAWCRLGDVRRRDRVHLRKRTCTWTVAVLAGHRDARCP
jgi:hypothetical protein